MIQEFDLKKEELKLKEQEISRKIQGDLDKNNVEREKIAKDNARQSEA